MKRENGIISEIGWPCFSCPCPVEDHLQTLIWRLPPEVTATIVGTGYHNAGWSYQEIEVRAPSWGRAYEEAGRLSDEVMFEFHYRNVMKGEQ